MDSGRRRADGHTGAGFVVAGRYDAVCQWKPAGEQRPKCGHGRIRLRSGNISWNGHANACHRSAV